MMMMMLILISGSTMQALVARDDCGVANDRVSVLRVLPPPGGLSLGPVYFVLSGG